MMLGIHRDISGISRISEIILPFRKQAAGYASEAESVVYPGSIMYP